MSLFQEWVDLYEGQDDHTFRKFWEDYSEAEIKIYTYTQGLQARNDRYGERAFRKT